MMRVVLTGSESVGKTTLATQLASHYGVLLVPEFVRDYAVAKGAPLDFRDHGPITRGTVALHDEYSRSTRARGDTMVVYDTDLVSTVVYCHHYFGQCPAFIEETAIARLADHYVLLDIDVPWIADGLRDRGTQREAMHALFVAALQRFGAPFTTVRGDYNARLQRSVALIDSLRASQDSSGAHSSASAG